MPLCRTMFKQSSPAVSGFVFTTFSPITGGMMKPPSNTPKDATIRQIAYEMQRSLYEELPELFEANETRFPNIFIEKRVSSCLKSLERSELFPFDILTHKRQNAYNVKIKFLHKAVI